MKALQDLKQSPMWGKYLHAMGWTIHVTSRGIQLMLMPTIIGGLVKIQHPTVVTKEDLIEIEKFCRDHKALFIKLEPYVAQDMAIFNNAGFVASRSPQCVPSTMYLDLTLSEAQMWEKISHSGKYSINRSRREGDKVVFYRHPTEEILRPYYEMCVDTGKLKKFYVQPYRELKIRVGIFGEHAVLGIVYDKEGNMASGKFYLGDKDLTLYVTGGTSRVGRSEKGGYLLMWESMLYLKTLGYKILDLEGVSDPRYPIFTKDWGGFTHFKEHFGGEIVRFPTPQIKYLNPFFRFMSRFNGFGL